MKAGSILVDGELADVVPVGDRGLQYGDGLFETIAWYEPDTDPQRWLWDKHMVRLARGCERLGIPAPTPSRLRSEALQVMDGVALGVLKIMVTRGTGARGYAPTPAPGRRILAQSPWPIRPPQWRRQGVDVDISPVTLGRNPWLAGTKHLNRLEQVMARAQSPHAAEALMFDSDGYLIEGIMSNVFLVFGDRVVTPRLDQAGVAGIMRETIMTVLQDGMSVEVAEARLGLEDLDRVEELFLSNRLIGVWPVRRLRGQTLGVGTLTGALQAQLEAAGLVPGEDAIRKLGSAVEGDGE